MNKLIEVFLVLFAGLMVSGCILQTPSTNISEQTNTSMNSTQPTNQLFSGDCGTDLGCFVNQSRTCTPSNVMYSLQVDFFGAIINNTDFLQINGTSADKCVFYIKTENVTVIYDANTTQQLLSSGETMAQIQQAEQKATEQANNPATAYNDTCLFDQPDLTAMLTGWENGTFSSTDFSNAKCTGNVFGNGNNNQKCTKNSDCGPNGLCNLDNNQCLQTMNVSYGCTSDSNCLTGESCDVVSGSCIKKNLTVNPSAPQSPFNYQYSLDPYANGGPSETQCRFINGSDIPALPDSVAFTYSRYGSMLKDFGRYFVDRWYSYCFDDTHLIDESCNAVPNGVGDISVNCTSGTTCDNGRCVSSSLVGSQTTCSDISGEGGRVLVCDGYNFQQSDGFLITPHVHLVNGKWNATISVKYGNSTTEYVPKFSGPNETMYFNTDDDSDTIGITVTTYGQFELGRIGMVMDIRTRYGIAPSIMHG